MGSYCYLTLLILFLSCCNFNSCLFNTQWLPFAFCKRFSFSSRTAIRLALSRKCKGKKWQSDTTLMIINTNLDKKKCTAKQNKVRIKASVLPFALYPQFEFSPFSQADWSSASYLTSVQNHLAELWHLEKV